MTSEMLDSESVDLRQTLHSVGIPVLNMKRGLGGSSCRAFVRLKRD